MADKVKGCLIAAATKQLGGRLRCYCLHRFQRGVMPRCVSSYSGMRVGLLLFLRYIIRQIRSVRTSPPIEPPTMAPTLTLWALEFSRLLSEASVAARVELALVDEAFEDRLLV